MGKTAIEWTDETWNPIRGCSRVSEGCRNCYAEQQAARIVRMGDGKPTPYDGLVKLVGPDKEPRWTGVVSFVPDVLSVPLRRRKPTRYFVNSMSDLFHEALSNEQIAAVFGVMAACPQHTFQCLTKRPARMREFLTHPEVRTWIARAKDAALVDYEHKEFESWRGIPGFAGYEASSHGRIRNVDGKLIQQQLNDHEQIGRYTVSIYKYGNQTTQFVHRLVLLAFAGPPREGEEACHRNGNKIDNRSVNLRWGTRSENQREKVRHGSRGGPAKLTTEQAAEIRHRRAGGETQQSIADAFGVSRSLVSMIESGAVWGDPDLPWPLPNVWLGVSVEDQAAADERIPELLRTPAAVRFLSCEPLLGPVDLERWLWKPCADGFDFFTGEPALGDMEARGDLNWVIAGCESGPGARPADAAWYRSLRDQCAEAGVPFFLKQATHLVEPGRFYKVGENLLDSIAAGPGSHRKPGFGAQRVIGAPYLDGVQHLAFPAVKP